MYVSSPPNVLIFITYLLIRQSASFRCPQEDCVGDGDFIRLHVAGASEASTIRSDLYCAVCGHKLEENMKHRSLGGQ